MGSLRGFGLARKLSSYVIKQIQAVHRAAQPGLISESREKHHEGTASQAWALYLVLAGGSWPNSCCVVSCHSGVDWLHGGVESCDSLLSVLALQGGGGGGEVGNTRPRPSIPGRHSSSLSSAFHPPQPQDPHSYPKRPLSMQGCMFIGSGDLRETLFCLPRSIV